MGQNPPETPEGCRGYEVRQGLARTEVTAAALQGHLLEAEHPGGGGTELGRVTVVSPLRAWGL